MKMEISDVKKAIKEIKQKLPDYEAAHSLEDKLYFDILTSISKDPSNAQELAKASIKVNKMLFARYTA